MCVDQLFSHSVNVEAARSNHTESYTIRRREETTSKHLKLKSTDPKLGSTKTSCRYDDSSKIYFLISVNKSRKFMLCHCHFNVIKSANRSNCSCGLKNLYRICSYTVKNITNFRRVFYTSNLYLYTGKLGLPH